MPARRGTEVVEGVLRHHISACFAALQRKLLDLLHDALPALRTVSAAGTKSFPGSPQSSPAVEVCMAPLHRASINHSVFFNRQAVWPEEHPYTACSVPGSRCRR